MKKNTTNKTKHYLWNAILSPLGLVSISKGPKKRYRQMLKRKDRVLLKVKVKGQIDDLVEEINGLAKASEGLAILLFERAFMDLAWEPVGFAPGNRSEDESLRLRIEEETRIKVFL